jgi:hypothetical protein
MDGLCTLITGDFVELRERYSLLFWRSGAVLSRGATGRDGVDGGDNVRLFLMFGAAVEVGKGRSLSNFASISSFTLLSAPMRPLVPLPRFLVYLSSPKRFAALRSGTRVKEDVEDGDLPGKLEAAVGERDVRLEVELGLEL